MTKVAEIFETLEYGPAPEAAGPALDWLAAHGKKFGHFIDGGFTKAGKTFASNNPANGESWPTSPRRANPKWKRPSKPLAPPFRAGRS